jgi:protein TonB
VSAVPKPVAVRERLVSLLLLTALLHGIILLGVSFSSGVGQKVSEGLEVLLVSEDMPEAADNPAARYLAQRSQKGAGNSRSGRTSTPDAVETAASPGPAADAAANSAALKTSAPQPTIEYAGPDLSPGKPKAPPESVTPDSTAAGRGSGEELVLRGDPATGQWLSPDTRAYRLAPYLSAWRNKVERLGTINYPIAARKGSTPGKLSSAPVIEVALLASGKLLEARVLQSSGDASLDQSALEILHLASPFNPLPAELARDYRVLRFAYQWEFLAGRFATSGVTAHTEASSDP